MQDFWVQTQDLQWVDYYDSFGRAAFKRRPDGHVGYLFAVHRRENWTIVYYSPFTWGGWLDFLENYVILKDNPARLSREERNRTRRLGKELARTVEAMIKDWDHLGNEPGGSSSCLSDYMMGLLGSNYLELRRVAYERLKKEWKVDYGIGDEFIYGGTDPKRRKSEPEPEWYEKWQSHSWRKERKEEPFPDTYRKLRNLPHGPGFEELLRKFVETLYIKKDFEGAFDLVEPHVPGRAKFLKFAPGHVKVAWLGREDVGSLDYFSIFARARCKRRPDGQWTRIYGVFRSGRWWIIYSSPLSESLTWLEFLRFYVAVRGNPASPAERDRTPEVGRELAGIVKAIIPAWRELSKEEYGDDPPDISKWLQGALGCNYLEVRRVAYEELKKEWKVDYGIGDEFIDADERTPDPDWYIKWGNHRKP